MAERGLEEPVQGLVADAPVRCLEPLADEAAELCRVDQPDLDPLRAPPERLVLVVEDPVEQMTLAAQVDVPDLRLCLEDGPHQVRVLGIEREDLLELVEDDCDPALALGGELSRQREQVFDRVVDRRAAAGRLEAETQRAVGG